MFVALVAIGGAARADGSARCDAVKIDAGDAMPPAWTAAIADLRAQVAQLARADCIAAHVRVEPSSDVAKDGVSLNIEAADGRVAQRRVREPSRLVAITLGVIASIPEEPAPTALAPPASSSPPSKDDVPDFTKPPVAAATKPPRTTQLTLGASAGARYGAPSGVAMAEIEARVDLVVQGWLVLASVRYAPLGMQTRGLSIAQFGYDELALGLGFGRRFALGAGTLDLALVPSVVLAEEEGIVPGGPTDDAVGDSLAYARLGASARWLFGTGGWRFGATLDADGAPSAFGGAKRVDPALPPIPSWTFGARLGAAGDLL